jgi:DNA-binding SARP family transcriptional activator/pimeloyl-ACP methyl ester carboxylesterase
VKAPVVRVLGPLELASADGPVVLGLRQRLVLAVLVARVGRVAPADVLIEAVWGDDAPADPNGALQTLVSRLRARLPDGLLETAPTGYRLRADPAIDAVLARDLVARAGDADGPDSLALLDDALALWRGPSFADLADRPAVEAEAVALDELHAATAERHGQRLIETGRAADAVAPLESLVRAWPLRDTAWAALMEALARAGRQAEALRCFARYREALAEETGLEPSGELRQLEAAILRGDLEPAGPPRHVGDTPLRLRAATVERARGERVAWATCGSGPPLVFTPGWLSNLDAFSDGSDPRGRLVAALARRFTVTLYDRFGTGLSGGDASDFSLDASVDELLAVMTAVGEPATVHASSATGPVAVAAAARSDLVARLVLQSTYVSGPALFADPGVTGSMLTLVRSSWGVGSRLLAGLIVPGIPSVSQSEFARFQRRAASPTVAAGYLDQLYRADVSALLPDVPQPALVLHYRDDPAIPFAGGQQLALGLSNAELVAFDGAFHTPPPDHADAIVAAIREFVDSSTPAVRQGRRRA